MITDGGFVPLQVLAHKRRAQIKSYFYLEFNSVCIPRILEVVKTRALIPGHFFAIFLNRNVGRAGQDNGKK